MQIRFEATLKRADFKVDLENPKDFVPRVYVFDVVSLDEEHFSFSEEMVMPIGYFVLNSEVQNVEIHPDFKDGRSYHAYEIKTMLEISRALTSVFRYECEQSGSSVVTQVEGVLPIIRVMINV